MPRILLVHGEKIFKISIPDNAKITFGPWSPPPKKGERWSEDSKKGTLRVYVGKEKNIVACFSNVSSFRDMSIGYAEEVAREEGATIWKSDEHGYMREDKMSRRKEWVDIQSIPALGSKKRK